MAYIYETWFFFSHVIVVYIDAMIDKNTTALSYVVPLLVKRF